MNTPNPIPEKPQQQWFAYILIAVVGAGSGFGGGTFSRTDPWTGTQALEAHDDIRHDFVESLQILKEDFREEMRSERSTTREYVDLRMRPCDEHLLKANQGWDYIYELRSDVKTMKAELNSLQESLRNLTTQLQANGVAH